MKTKKRAAIGILCAAVVLSSIAALAYFNDMSGLTNDFQVGKNSIKLIEQYEPPKEINTGDNVFIKEIQFENTGNVDCYIRAFMDFSDSEVKKSAFLSTEAEGDDSWIKADEFEKTPPENWEYISLDGIDGDKLLGGYYYYKIPLKPGEKTSYLLRRVNAEFDSAEQVKAFDIIVSAESVSISDKDGGDFTDYRECWKEFMERR